MRKTSLLLSSQSDALYSGNEKIFLKKAVTSSGTTYKWNPRFSALLDAFFLGTPIHNLSETAQILVAKYISYANGTLAPTDDDYQLIIDFDNYLPTYSI